MILRSTNQISGLNEMLMGNQPRDDGNLILDESEYKELIKKDPNSKKFIKKFVGATELIKGEKRWCLWINDRDKEEAIKNTFIKDRLDKVQSFRKNSDAISTKAHSKTPHRFVQIQHEPCKAIAIPKTTASRREYLPIDFVDDQTVLSDLVFGIYEPEIYLFGVLSSKMHTAWLKTVSGRFGDSYRYSSVICYNSFIFPKIDNEKKQEIEKIVFKILDIREIYSDKTLVQMYDPDYMPENLKKAHETLNEIIDACYRKEKFYDEYDRISYLFNLYGNKIKTNKLI